MRVIGNISHPSMKITVFETDNRFPVQFEAGNVAQIFRIRRGGPVENLADVKLVVDEAMCTQVLELLRRQSELSAHVIKRKIQLDGPTTEDDLPSII